MSLLHATVLSSPGTPTLPSDFQQWDIDVIADCITYNGPIVIDSEFPGEALIPRLSVLNGGISTCVEIGAKRGKLTGLVLPNISKIAGGMSI